MTSTGKGKETFGNPIRASRCQYNHDPDYTRPLLEIPEEMRKHMLDRLAMLYGQEEAEKWMPELERALKVHHAYKPSELIEVERDYDPKERFTQQDMMLITYGDMLHGEGETPLAVLHQFVSAYNQGGINTLHLLPFFPYSS
ncbi:MAG: sugar phosphorylase, partial [Deltaproteobacteria bacterium]|nr:sugar phosphorylase [Deltaproteobacteria bacterium]